MNEKERQDIIVIGEREPFTKKEKYSCLCCSQLLEKDVALERKDASKSNEFSSFPIAFESGA